MLKWLRLRRSVEEIRRVAARPLWIAHSRQPELVPSLWHSSYCCTLMYYWTAVVTEDVCRGRRPDGEKREALRGAFGKIVEGSGGGVAAALQRIQPEGHTLRRRALADLKRAVDLYRGTFDDRYMIYPEYREAVEQDGRPAAPGNPWQIRREAAHEILLSSYLANNARRAEAATPAPALGLRGALPA